MANKFHSDIQHTDGSPPDGLPKAVKPTPSAEAKPPYIGAVGPTGSGYPKIYPKVKVHVKSEGI